MNAACWPSLHEADLLAVALVGHAQSELAGNPANLGLSIAAHRQQHPVEQPPLDAEQHVRLVLAVVKAAAQSGSAAGSQAGDQLGIVAGGDELGSDAIGVVE